MNAINHSYSGPLSSFNNCRVWDLAKMWVLNGTGLLRKTVKTSTKQRFNNWRYKASQVFSFWLKVFNVWLMFHGETRENLCHKKPEHIVCKVSSWTDSEKCYDSSHILQDGINTFAQIQRHKCHLWVQKGPWENWGSVQVKIYLALGKFRGLDSWPWSCSVTQNISCIVRMEIDANQILGMTTQT